MFHPLWSKAKRQNSFGSDLTVGLFFFGGGGGGQSHRCLQSYGWI